jgi:hypothetical protein
MRLFSAADFVSRRPKENWWRAGRCSGCAAMMRRLIGAGLIAVSLSSSIRASEDFFDRIEQALTFSGLSSTYRARLSGLLDVEGYQFQIPAPLLLRAPGTRLFNPRLTLFLDAQAGSSVYFFAQARADRGFDPAAREARVRLDEYALRITPWRDRSFHVQVGKFATVVGNWTVRHASWSNPFISAPLPYEYLTGVWDNEAVLASGTLLQWSHVQPGLSPRLTAVEKALRIPIIWGPAYTTGVAVSGATGALHYAAELKHASLSSRPAEWQHTNGRWDHPTLGARVAYRPNPMWNVGMSASAGSYLRPFAGTTVAAGHNRGDYREIVVGQDLGFAWHHLQIWTEIFATRFTIPTVGDADTLAYYAEAKYKFTPQLFGAVRWNQQLFGTIPHQGTDVRWGHDVWRIDVAPTYRFTAHTQVKLQYTLQHGNSGARAYSRAVALQLTLRF